MTLKKIMTILPILNTYERPDICGPCGGECCKTMPGTYAPEQFGSTREHRIAHMHEAFSAQLASIDSWEGDTKDDGNLDEEVLYVRPAHKDFKLWDRSWGGRSCVFLLESGCSLTSATRPHGCLNLVPGKGRNCVDADYPAQPKWFWANKWRDFQDEIFEAARDL